jgi:putative membrane protein
MRKVIACGTVALAFALAPSLAGAQSTSATTMERNKATTGSSSMKADENFVVKAAKGGMAEVEFGKLAAEKASSPEVKQFGQKMVDDHGKANDELKSIAEKKSITIPTAMDAKDKAAYNRLSKLSGAAFDRAYMKDMVSDHKTDVSEFQYEARSGADADVRSFASKTLPTLQDHLKMAESTNGAVATSGSKTAKPAATSGSKTSKPAGTSGTRGTSPSTTPNGSTGTTPGTR